MSPQQIDPNARRVSGYATCERCKQWRFCRPVQKMKNMQDGELKKVRVMLCLPCDYDTLVLEGD